MIVSTRRRFEGTIDGHQADQNKGGLPGGHDGDRALMNAEAGTPKGERLDVLATLVEAYERQHFPMDLPDPVEAIKFRMEQSGLGPKDLVPMIGQLNRV
jgi:hypothetical protein